MALKMRPTGLGSGFYKDDLDYSVFCGEWCIGRIYEKRSSPDHLRWFWSLFCPSKPESLRISNQVATLEIAPVHVPVLFRREVLWPPTKTHLAE